MLGPNRLRQTGDRAPNIVKDGTPAESKKRARPHEALSSLCSSRRTSDTPGLGAVFREVAQKRQVAHHPRYVSSLAAIGSTASHVIPCL
jgi:hypothetical protein